MRLIAGTPWLWAREELRGAVDVLFVDEAGQMALADALAIAGAAHGLVLLGDPQQLAHVEPGHPPARLGRLRARAPARRPRDDPPGRGRVPRAHLAHAPGRLPLRVEHDVRRPARARRGHGAPGRRVAGAVGRGRADDRGRARREPPERARGGRADRRGGREAARRRPLHRRGRRGARPGARGHPRRDALQRPGRATCGHGCRAARASAPWTSSRARRRPSSSSR